MKLTQPRPRNAAGDRAAHTPAFFTALPLGWGGMTAMRTRRSRREQKRGSWGARRFYSSARHPGASRWMRFGHRKTAWTAPTTLCAPRAPRRRANMPVTRARRKRSSRRRQAIPRRRKTRTLQGITQRLSLPRKTPEESERDTESLPDRAGADTREKQREDRAQLRRDDDSPPLPQRPRGGAHPSPSHAATSSLSQAADELTQRRSDCLTPAQRNNTTTPPPLQEQEQDRSLRLTLTPAGRSSGQDLSPADDGFCVQGKQKTKNQPRADASRTAAVGTQSERSREALLAVRTLCGIEVRAQVAQNARNARGVLLDIDLPGSETEIISLIETPINILRATLRGSSMFVTFEGPQAPDAVYIRGVRVRVQHLDPRPIQCDRCGRFNHLTSACRSGPRCGNCGGSHYTPSCTEHTQKCANCGGKHHFSSPKCRRGEKSKLLQAQLPHKICRSARRNANISAHAISTTPKPHSRTPKPPPPRAATARPHDDLHLFLQRNQDIDIICLQEANCLPSECRLPGFVAYHNATACLEDECTISKCHEATHRPGRSRVVIYVRSGSAHSEVDLSTFDSDRLECAGVIIRFGRTETTVLSIYIPPACAWDASELRTLRKLCGRDVVMCGDVNAHHHSWGSPHNDTRGSLLVEQLGPTGLTPIHTGEHTFVRRGGTRTCIDVTLPCTWGSDHHPIRITARVRGKPRSRIYNIVRWPEYRKNIDTQEGNILDRMSSAIAASTTKQQVNQGQPVQDMKLLNLRAARQQAQPRAMRTEAASD
ncbi:hypothetical protein HPB48_026945 [Haemaphysalis longicornis]|uniref:Endonuclease/exonuclease/phosphatase domain-containing protein n=1 Tax=Haemaphysalis longicornis TaxID=44386 RepID=A0A9J6HAZ0_HAELO|nr:hypothetical protein HPB48_026945 [Haemaphysalis longicornis]